METTRHKSIALYSRVNAGATDPQEVVGLNWAKKSKPESPVYVYQDMNIPARSDDLRRQPRMRELINDVQSGKIGSVWVLDLSRLGRNSNSISRIFSELKKANTDLYVNGKPYDLNNSFGVYFP